MGFFFLSVIVVVIFRWRCTLWGGGYLPASSRLLVLWTLSKAAEFGDGTVAVWRQDDFPPGQLCLISLGLFTHCCLRSTFPNVVMKSQIYNVAVLYNNYYPLSITFTFRKYNPIWQMPHSGKYSALLWEYVSGSWLFTSNSWCKKAICSPWCDSVSTFFCIWCHLQAHGFTN